MFEYYEYVLYVWRLYMDKYNISGVKTFEFTKIINIDNVEFGTDIIIDDYVLIYAKKKVRIGNHVHIASFTSITGNESFIMEDFTGISQGCRLVTSCDDFKDWGFGNPTIPIEYRNLKNAPIIMERLSLIGANSVVLPGVTIGEGVTVGACSVVTRDLEPWGIYIGNKRVGERNKDGIMENYEKLLKELD